MCTMFFPILFPIHWTSHFKDKISSKFDRRKKKKTYTDWNNMMVIKW